MIRLGIDVGGSGTKGALADLDTGELAGDRLRLETPADFGFDGVVAAVSEIIGNFDSEGPIGIGFPSVVVRGVVKSPPTAHEVGGWVGKDLAAAVADKVQRDIVVLNDADAAATAERNFGAGQNRDGVVMVFTLGTGVGSALFIDGKLVPNTELGKLFLADEPDVSENYVASRARDEDGISWDQYGQRLNEYFQHVQRLFTPDLIIVGGGVSKKHEKFLHHVNIDAEVVPAQLRNHAGIVGAALSAASTEP
jgi:polyphosphate glucokinase